MDTIPYVLIRMRKRCLLAVLCLMLSFTLSGCDKEEGGEKKEVKFTVVEEKNLPDKLSGLINEKKGEEFRFSYTDGNSLYLARGYGAKMNGGYTIKVTGLYVQGEELHFITELLGSEQQDLVVTATTYPYIVVKLEFIDKTVIIE